MSLQRLTCSSLSLTSDTRTASLTVLDLVWHDVHVPVVQHDHRCLTTSSRSCSDAACRLQRRGWAVFDRFCMWRLSCKQALHNDQQVVNAQASGLCLAQHALPCTALLHRHCCGASHAYSVRVLPIAPLPGGCAAPGRFCKWCPCMPTSLSRIEGRSHPCRALHASLAEAHRHCCRPSSAQNSAQIHVLGQLVVLHVPVSACDGSHVSCPLMQAGLKTCSHWRSRHVACCTRDSVAGWALCCGHMQTLFTFSALIAKGLLHVAGSACGVLHVSRHGKQHTKQRVHLYFVSCAVRFPGIALHITGLAWCCAFALCYLSGCALHTNFLVAATASLANAAQMHNPSVFA